MVYDGRHGPSYELMAYANIDWASDFNTHKSTLAAGYMGLAGCGAQKTVTL